METAEQVYRELQQHLDKQPVGFPATKSGVEIRLLKELFTPEEARLALNVDYKPRSAQEIFEKVKDSGISLAGVQSLLSAMDNNGSIGAKEKKGTRLYFTMPLLI